MVNPLVGSGANDVLLSECRDGVGVGVGPPEAPRGMVDAAMGRDERAINYHKAVRLSA